METAMKEVCIVVKNIPDLLPIYKEDKDKFLMEFKVNETAIGEV